MLAIIGRQFLLDFETTKSYLCAFVLFLSTIIHVNISRSLYCEMLKKKKISLAFGLLPPKTLYICIIYSPNLPHQQKYLLNHGSVAVLVTQSCPTLCNPMNCYCSPGSFVHGILQTRILEWISTPFSRGSS